MGFFSAVWDYATRPVTMVIDIAQGKDVLKNLRDLCIMAGPNTAGLAAVLSVTSTFVDLAEGDFNATRDLPWGDKAWLVHDVIKGDVGLEALTMLTDHRPHVMAEEHAMSALLFLAMYPPYADRLPQRSTFDQRMLVFQFSRIVCDANNPFRFRLELCPGAEGLGVCLAWDLSRRAFFLEPLDQATFKSCFTYRPDKKLEVSTGECLIPKADGKGFTTGPASTATTWIFQINGTIVMEQRRRAALSPLGILPYAGLAPELMPMWEVHALRDGKPLPPAPPS